MARKHSKKPFASLTSGFSVINETDDIVMQSFRLPFVVQLGGKINGSKEDLDLLELTDESYIFKRKYYYEVRQYQAGDEDDNNVLTNGTTTWYKELCDNKNVVIQKNKLLSYRIRNLGWEVVHTSTYSYFKTAPRKALKGGIVFCPAYKNGFNIENVDKCIQTFSLSIRIRDDSFNGDVNAFLQAMGDYYIYAEYRDVSEENFQLKVEIPLDNLHQYELRAFYASVQSKLANCNYIKVNMLVDRGSE